MAAIDSPYSGMMDFSSQVSDSLVPNVDSTACKIGDSDSDISDTVSLVSHFSMPRPVSAPPYTSLYKMNICSTSVFDAPHVVAQQVMNSDAALYSVIIPETRSSKSHFHISCYLEGRNRTTKVAAMVDSGATSLFIDHKYASKHKMTKVPLEQPILLYNIDGSRNEAGSIMHKVRLNLRVGKDKEKFDFYVTSLGPKKEILGLHWLHHRNPQINWQEGTMQLNADQQFDQEPLELEVTHVVANCMERRRLLTKKVLDTSQDKLFCLAGFTYSQQIAEKAIAAKGKKTFEEMVPPQYRDFAKVFSEEESQRLPAHQPWDHTINLEPDAVQHWKIKSYPMSPAEQVELDKFLTEHLAKGYLVPSKSPMASPVFFIKKKDGKLRLVQDYRWLNKITIKNRYPLPLAADIINQLTKAKYFTKFDVRWGYHNIRIW